MEYDQDKVDEITLALLWLTSFKDPAGVRAWKGQDWDTMERLHTKGFISDPKSKAKSVVLSEEGEERSMSCLPSTSHLNARSHERPRTCHNPLDSGYGRVGDNPTGTRSNSLLHGSMSALGCSLHLSFRCPKVSKHNVIYRDDFAPVIGKVVGRPLVGPPRRAWKN